MVAFIAEQQKAHRDAFIKDCRQKPWGAPAMPRGSANSSMS
jgi:hypothetical protein